MYVVEFGPEKKIKNATKAAKFLREYLHVDNRLQAGDSSYARDGGFACLPENPIHWQKIQVIRNLSNWRYGATDTFIFLTGDKDYIGTI